VVQLAPLLLVVYAVLLEVTDASNGLLAARSSGGLVRVRAGNPPLRGGSGVEGQGVASSFSSTTGTSRRGSRCVIYADPCLCLCLCLYLCACTSYTQGSLKPTP
jgi:hypothetical protein